MVANTFVKIPSISKCIVKDQYNVTHSGFALQLQNLLAQMQNFQAYNIKINA